MKHPDKILSTTEFVLWVDKSDLLPNYRLIDRVLNKCSLNVKYSKLMQTPLALEMFVALKDGEVLEMPNIDEFAQPTNAESAYIKMYDRWEEARKKILFEGWELTKAKGKNEVYNKQCGQYILFGKGTIILNGNAFIETIEGVIKLNLTGTDNFWNRIGL